jgi:hypothetical protein
MPQAVSSTRGSRWVGRFAHPASWLGAACAVLVVDYITGPDIQFPVAAILPVALAAWHRGVRWALPFALGQPVAHFACNFFWDTSWSTAPLVANLLIRVAVLGGFSWVVAFAAEQKRRVSILERLLCVCAWCKRIRDKQDAWQPLETYLANEGGPQITHGICPDCQRKEFSKP